MSAGRHRGDPKTGARRVDKEKCIGCHLCEKACPWGMMTFDVEEKKASKCFLCDGEPKCVSTVRPPPSATCPGWTARVMNRARASTATCRRKTATSAASAIVD
ncbi:MAG: 4Fe-4S binding protein [Sutterella wadsworthensis]